MKRSVWALLLVVLVFTGCSGDVGTLAASSPDRESLIPPEQVKIQPETDIYPPKSLSAEYDDPVPLPFPVNTAGAEDFSLHHARWEYPICLVHAQSANTG